jgi:uncharacterized protein YkwD
MNRRWLLVGASAAIVTPLAGCQSTVSTGDGAGASGSGASYLANIRSSNNLPALSADSALERAALQQAGYMANSGRMTHSAGWGKDFALRMTDNGIGGVKAENIAHGDIDPTELFSRWMISAGHRRNMLDPRFTRYSLAYAREAGNPRQRYWVLVLAS